MARWWREFLDFDPGKLDTTFSSVSTGELVAVSGIRVWSLCEHHLLPFWCDISIGYYPQARIIGLSKFARIAHDHAHDLQVQERLVAQIADTVSRITESPDVIVAARGEHLCMTMRGVRSPAIMSSVVSRGRFADAAAQDLFFRMATP